MTNRPAVSATYFTTVSPRRRFGISALTSVPDNAEAVIGVVAGQVKLDHRAPLDDDFRRREGEAFRGDADNTEGLRASRAWGLEGQGQQLTEIRHHD